MGLIFGSLLLDLAFLAASLALYLYTRLKKRLRAFEDAGIPYVPAKSLFDNNVIGALSKESVGETYDRLYKELAPHKYGGMFFTIQPSILLRDPETITRLFITDFQYFNDHGLPIDEETNPMEGNLFSLSGQKWRALRRKLVPTFTSGKLRNMFPLIDACADNLTAKICRGGRIQEATDLVARLTTDVIASCAFGHEPESLNNPENRFRRMGKQMFNPSIYQSLKIVLRIIFPSLFRKFHIQIQDNDVWEFVETVITQTFSHRMSTGEKRNDFIQLLIELKEKGSIEHDPIELEQEEFKEEMEDQGPLAKLEFTQQLLTAQALVFFVAGFETTATTTGFLLYFLASDTEAQEKARREVREAPGGKITYETVTKMTYLNACINETLRLYPPFQVLIRKCEKDYTMEDGKEIKKGMMVLVPVYSLHRDPAYYPSPNEFRPERFMGDETPAPGTYMPFGYGPRICIDALRLSKIHSMTRNNRETARYLDANKTRRFALLEVATVVAKILDGFRISLSPRTETPLKIKTKFFVPTISAGLWLNWEKIKN